MQRHARQAPFAQVLHDKCRAVGIEEFVCKPFRVQDLQRVLYKDPSTGTML